MQPFYDLEFGDIIFRMKGCFEHKGIYLGYNLVCHLTPVRGPHISTLEEFLDGNPILKIEKVLPSMRSLIMERVFAELRKAAPYDLVKNNCQHFVNRIVKGSSYSEGLAVGSLLLIAGLGLWVVSSSRS
ncbi:MAG: lecithin retinol acyltransferase family protein [Nitrospirota bacterium]|nr:lecithin retinol acyltransferase family protein [Nitrospirota bacterium]